jgi:flotillin
MERIMLEGNLLFLTILAALIVILAIFIIAKSYTVVPPHEAHVVVSRGKGRKLFYSRDEKARSAYWHVPVIQQRAVLPLENIQIQINDIPLRDKDMAKFSGDVRCYLNIFDPVLAAERLGKVEPQQTATGFPAIEKDVKDLIEAITRNASMAMDVFAIMKQRDQFSQVVEDKVNEELDGWGLKLIDLEVIHFKDIEGYTVIKDLERRQAKVIETETRKQVAEYEKEASIVESVTNKEKEMQKALNEEEYRTRQIEKDQKIGERQKLSDQMVAKAEMEANKDKVEASRALTVGNAEVSKEAMVVTAEGDAESTKKRGGATAEVTKMTGFAQADVTKQQAFAEAEGTEKKAVALKQYTDAGLSVEMIRAQVDIKKAQFAALAEGLKVAKINLVTSGESNILGIPISAEVGADLGAMLVSLQNQGVNISDLLSKLPISETAKLAIAAKMGVDVVKEAEKQKEKPQPEKPQPSKVK